MGFMVLRVSPSTSKNANTFTVAIIRSWFDSEWGTIKTIDAPAATWICARFHRDDTGACRSVGDLVKPAFPGYQRRALLGDAAVAVVVGRLHSTDPLSPVAASANAGHGSCTAAGGVLAV